MEAHPVPQNVTSFEFRLVGDMTLKQFIYLASGVGMAYLLFITIAAAYPIIAWPLIAIFSLLGVAYAFLPIQDRPLDHWTNAFFKAIYAPTKRSWRKAGKDLTQDLIFKNRLNIYLSSPTAFQIPASAPVAAITTEIPVKPSPQPAPPLHPVQFNPPPNIQTPNPAPVVSVPTQPQAPEPLPTHKELTQTVELGKQAQSLQLRMIENERQLTQIKKKASENTGDNNDLTLKFNDVFENLQKLTQEASSVKQQLSSLTKQPEPQFAPLKVEIVTPKKVEPTQVMLTSLPNIINGIVSSPTGGYLESVVVVIHDKDNLPVRALKTNKLGQFLGSTPLPNGVYTVEMEKDGFTFDLLKMTLEGNNLPPLMITAKPAASS